jgi:hypothetical protein
VLPVETVRAFATRLQQAGVSVELVEEDGIERVGTGPRLERAIEPTVLFFNRHLRRDTCLCGGKGVRDEP